MTTREPTSLWICFASHSGLLALTGLLACTPSIEDYPRELEEAFCVWQHECHVYERVRDCVDARVIDRDPQYDYLVRAAAAGSVEYDRDAAAECLDAIRERSCDNNSPEPEVCDRVFLGKVGRNAPCLSTAECAGNAVCGFDPTCTDQCCVGACRVFADPVEIGEPCSFSGVGCVPEAFCATDPVTFLPTVCTALVKAGGDCSLGQACVAEANCDGEVCRKIEELAVGERCDEPNTRCAEPAFCNYNNGGVPRGKIEATLGAPCEPGDSCGRFDTYCDQTSGLCTLLPGPGQSCVNSNCLPYATCEGGNFEGSGNPECVRLPAEGDACEEFGRCLGDLECNEGRCSLPALETAPVCKVPGP